MRQFQGPVEVHHHAAMAQQNGADDAARGGVPAGLRAGSGRGRGVPRRLRAPRAGRGPFRPRRRPRRRRRAKAAEGGRGRRRPAATPADACIAAPYLHTQIGDRRPCRRCCCSARWSVRFRHRIVVQVRSAGRTGCTLRTLSWKLQHHRPRCSRRLENVERSAVTAGDTRRRGADCTSRAP